MKAVETPMQKSNQQSHYISKSISDDFITQLFKPCNFLFASALSLAEQLPVKTSQRSDGGKEDVQT